MTTLSAAACWVMLTAAGCSTSVGSAMPSAGLPAAASGPAVAVAESVQRTIDVFNATAGGPVAAQQAVLGRLVSPGQRSVQNSCPAATTTISFEPIYPRLAPSPDWRPTGGSLPGDVYALPTLIRIYVGSRITGTDLTDLHVAVDAGQLRLPALCLG